MHRNPDTCGSVKQLKVITTRELFLLWNTYSEVNAYLGGRSACADVATFLSRHLPAYNSELPIESTMATSRISELSMSILTSTGKIDTYLQRKGLPTISFNALGPGRYGTIPVSPDIEETRVGAVKAVTELLELLQGPSISLKPTVSPPPPRVLCQAGPNTSMYCFASRFWHP
jgi:hypothetical protein